MCRSTQWSSLPHVVAKVRSGWTPKASGSGGRCAIRARLGAVRWRRHDRRVGQGGSVPEPCKRMKPRAVSAGTRQRVESARIARGEKTQEPARAAMIGRSIHCDRRVDPSIKNRPRSRLSRRQTACGDVGMETPRTPRAGATLRRAMKPHERCRDMIPGQAMVGLRTGSGTSPDSIKKRRCMTRRRRRCSEAIHNAGGREGRSASGRHAALKRKTAGASGRRPTAVLNR